ncbi:MAG: SprB repeat-containing protein [Bacteroidetes bacterium]|nr:SprB repeat-containing protein [Bacteroidota bacterium]
MSNTTALFAQELEVLLTPGNYTGFNISCFGARDGNIDATVTGGTPPYTYSWTNGATTQDLTAIAAGYYKLIAKDFLGNTAIVEITLTEPEPMNVDLLLSNFPNGYNISCYNCFNGHILLQAGGGIGPYTYAWEDGPTTQDRFNLGRGDYVVNITDANQCELRPELFQLTEPDRSDWTQFGNTGSDPSVHFIGTTDNKDLLFKTLNSERLRIAANGTISISSLASNNDNYVKSNQNGNLYISSPSVPWETRGNNNIQTSADYLGTNNSADLIIKTNANGTGGERIRIKSSGQIGINNSNPLSSFQFGNYLGLNWDDNIGTDPFIGYNIYLQNGIKKRNEIGFASFMEFDNQGNFVFGHEGSGPANSTINSALTSIKCWNDGKVSIGKNTISQNIQLEIGGNTFVDGLLGIGLNSPLEKLHVAGSALFTFDNTPIISVPFIQTLSNGYNTTSSPSFTWWNDINTGIFHDKDNHVGISAGGVEIIRMANINNQPSVGIGIDPSTAILSSTDYTLLVNGKLGAKEIYCSLGNPWPDYVFESDYELLTITSLRNFVSKNKHLPGVPSASELENMGANMMELMSKAYEKIEELHLYIFDLEERLRKLEEGK